MHPLIIGTLILLILVVSLLIHTWRRENVATKDDSRKDTVSEATDQSLNDVRTFARAGLWILRGAAIAALIGLWKEHDTVMRFLTGSADPKAVKEWVQAFWLQIVIVLGLAYVVSTFPFTENKKLLEPIRTTIVVALGLGALVFFLAWMENPPWQGGGVRVAVPKAAPRPVVQTECRFSPIPSTCVFGHGLTKSVNTRLPGTRLCIDPLPRGGGYTLWVTANSTDKFEPWDESWRNRPIAQMLFENKHGTSSVILQTVRSEQECP